MSTYSLTINFYSFDELNDFITIYNKINLKTENKTIKSVNDKRGSKTIRLHMKAKEYKTSHPELSYRQCLIQVSKPEQPIELIDEIPEPFIEVFEDVINI